MIIAQWRELAACRHEDPDLFFPTGTHGPALEATRHAKAICARCPVTTACLDWALAHDPTAGIWGATTEEERRERQRHHPVVPAPRDPAGRFLPHRSNGTTSTGNTPTTHRCRPRSGRRRAR